VVKEVMPMEAKKKPLPRSRKYRIRAKTPKHQNYHNTKWKKYRLWLLAAILLMDALLLLDHIIRTV
jgi:hypothetical protein